MPRFIDERAGAYYPITRADYFDEVLLYGPRAHASFLDLRPRGDFSLAEYPKSPSFLPMLNPLVMGGLGKILGSIKVAFIASDFLFPGAIFLIVYFLLYEITGMIFGSTLLSILFLFIPKLGISFPPMSAAHLQTLAQIVIPWRADMPLYFSQFEEPKITFVFFALCAYLIIRAMKRGGKSNTIAAGISFGILFYTYLYDWATMLVTLGIMAVVFLVQKDYSRMRIIVAIAGVGLFVSSYFWINLLQLKNLPQAADVIARLGGEFSHQFRFATVWKSYIRIFVLIPFLFAFVKKELRPALIAISAMLASYIIVVNEQVITGFNVQPDHWYRTQFLPIYIALCLLGAECYRRIAPYIVLRYARTIAIIFVIYFLGGSFVWQYTYAKSHASLFAIPRERMESFNWLAGHAPAGSVVGTLSFDDNLDLQLHTPHYIFLPFGLSTIAPYEEIWQRFFIMAKLWNLPPQEFTAFVKEANAAYYLLGDQYGVHSFDGHFFPSGWSLPDIVMQEKQKIYMSFFAEKKLSAFLYRLDYLYIDREKFPQWKAPLALLPYLAPVYENARIRIYKVESVR